VQQLSGRLQEQQHTIAQLQNQQRSFYDDLSHRVQQVAHPSGVLPASDKRSQSVTDKPAVADAELKDSAIYRLAFSLLVKKQYDNALSEFQNYVTHYPQGAFVANAYYWLGELYLKKKDFDKAQQSFTRLTSQYPTSNKVPEAQLKLATIHIAQGK